MISGRQTLAGIERNIRDERARLAEVDRRLAAAGERLVAIDAARAEGLAELARLHVGGPADGGEAATRVRDERVQAMLAGRRAEREELEARLRELDGTVDRLEEEREALADSLEAATDRLDTAEAATQARLDADPAYRAQRERAHAVERVAGHAADKAAQSEEERAEKGRAYENDPLFWYLWRRGYGTADYRAGPLTRWLDRKVARLVSFDGARANYARLVDLPVRLDEHAERMAAAAEEEIDALRRMDEEARAADGVEALERERDAADEALTRHDAAIEEARAARRETFERIERMDRGEDDAYGQAVAFLAGELDRDDLQELRRAALATPHPEDDAIVARLRDLEDERARLEDAIRDLKEVARGNRARLQELESVRREFTARRYDEPGAGFPDGDLVTGMLTQFLRGAATREVLWRVLESQLRDAPRRSSGTFGSGGFGRGSPWTGGSWPRSGGRRGGFGGGMGSFGGGSRSSGGLRGGGFRTGGRMRGGGFKTGGRR